MTLSRGHDEVRERDIKDLGKTCAKQSDQQVQRSWGGTSLVYLRKSKKANVIERVREVGRAKWHQLV